MKCFLDGGLDSTMHICQSCQQLTPTHWGRYLKPLWRKCGKFNSPFSLPSALRPTNSHHHMAGRPHQQRGWVSVQEWFGAADNLVQISQPPSQHRKKQGDNYWLQEGQIRPLPSPDHLWFCCWESQMRFHLADDLTSRDYADVPTPAMTVFSRGNNESILTNCVTSWFGNSRAEERQRLDRIVGTAEKIIAIIIF